MREDVDDSGEWAKNLASFSLGKNVKRREKDPISLRFMYAEKVANQSHYEAMSLAGVWKVRPSDEIQRSVSFALQYLIDYYYLRLLFIATLVYFSECCNKL